MKQLNNKAQVLVIFVILLPIILLLLLVTIEVGNIYIEKSKTKNTIKEIITNGLNNNLPNDTINTLVDMNIKNIKEKSIYTSETEIEINIKQNKKIFGRNLEIKYKYKGIKEDKITISEG